MMAMGNGAALVVNRPSWRLSEHIRHGGEGAALGLPFFDGDAGIVVINSSRLG